MQNRLVAGVAKGAKELALRLARLRQHCERLICMGGDHHGVEALAAARGVDQFDPGAVAQDRNDGVRNRDPVGIGLRQTLHIGAAAADDGAPLRSAR